MIESALIIGRGGIEESLKGEKKGERDIKIYKTRDERGRRGRARVKECRCTIKCINVLPCALAFLLHVRESYIIVHINLVIDLLINLRCNTIALWLYRKWTNHEASP